MKLQKESNKSLYSLGIGNSSSNAFNLQVCHLVFVSSLPSLTLAAFLRFSSSLRAFAATLCDWRGLLDPQKLLLPSLLVSFTDSDLGESTFPVIKWSERAALAYESLAS